MKYFYKTDVFLVLRIALIAILLYGCGSNEKNDVVCGKWKNPKDEWQWEFLDGDSIKMQSNIKNDEITVSYKIENDSILVYYYNGKIIKNIIYFDQDTFTLIHRGVFAREATYIRESEPR